MTIPPSTRMLSGLAWTNVTVHIVALILALVGMRPGSPLVPLEDRLRYLASGPPLWSLGWGAWMLCTVALVAFFAALAQTLSDNAPLAGLAVMVAVAGGAIDLFCDAICICVLPRLASDTAPPHAIFLAIEQVANVGGLVVANGLYAVGTLLLTLCLRAKPQRTPGVTAAGCGTFAAAMSLVAAGFLGDARLAEWGTGPTIILFCAWTVLASRSAGALGGRP